MNKGDLINEVAKVVSTKKEAQEAVDCVFSSITKAMKTGDPLPWSVWYLQSGGKKGQKGT